MAYTRSRAYRIPIQYPYYCFTLDVIKIIRIVLIKGLGECDPNIKIHVFVPMYV